MEFRDHNPVTTTDATLTTIAALEIPEYFSGLLEYWVVGLDDFGSGQTVILKQAVKIKKTTTLTIGTPVDIIPLDDDLTIGGISVANVSENIEIQVTGVASVTINWIAATVLLMTNATTLP